MLCGWEAEHASWGYLIARAGVVLPSVTIADSLSRIIPVRPRTFAGPPPAAAGALRKDAGAVRAACDRCRASPEQDPKANKAATYSQRKGSGLDVRPAAASVPELRGIA